MSKRLNLHQARLGKINQRVDDFDILGFLYNSKVREKKDPA